MTISEAERIASHSGEWVASYIRLRLTDPGYQAHPSLAHDAMAIEHARRAARAAMEIKSRADD